jgi:hypothetical protein
MIYAFEKDSRLLPKCESASVAKLGKQNDRPEAVNR